MSVEGESYLREDFAFDLIGGDGFVRGLILLQRQPYSGLLLLAGTTMRYSAPRLMRIKHFTNGGIVRSSTDGQPIHHPSALNFPPERQASVPQTIF